MQNIALEKGLPANLDAERYVLGSIMMDDATFISIAGTLQADDFCLEKHRRISRAWPNCTSAGNASIV